MAWVFTDGVDDTINVRVSSVAEAVFRFKQMLKAMGGIVAASGDGLSAYSLGAHPYTSHSDVITGFGTGANGINALCWFVVKLPNGNMLGFQRSTAGTPTNWNLRWIPRNLDISPQTLSGGSSTVTATASVVSQYLCGTTASTYFSWLSGEPTTNSDGPTRLNMAYDDSTGAIWMMTWIPGSTWGGSGSAFLLDPVLAAAPEDADPWVIYAGGYNSTWKCFSDYLITDSAYGPQGYLGRGMSNEKWGAIQALYYRNRAGSMYVPSGLGSNPHTGEDDGLPVIYARPAQSSAALNILTPGYKGVSSVVRFQSYQMGNGQLLANKTRIAFGYLTFPWKSGEEVVL